MKYSFIAILITVTIIVEALTDSDLTSIVLFGETGVGKSTLGNTLLSAKVFSESDGVNAYTQETVAHNGRFLSQAVRVTDTPGLGEASVDADPEHLRGMANKITPDGSVQAIGIVVDFLHPRFEQKEKELFDLIIKMFPDSPWYEHVAIVWTHFYPFLPQEMKDKRARRERDVKKKLVQFFGSEVPAEKLEKIPQFFLDSIDARKEGTESHLEAIRLLEWAKSCKLFKEDMAAMRVPDGPAKIEERVVTEKGGRRVIEWKAGARKYWLFGPEGWMRVVLETQTDITLRRTIQHMTDGTDDVSEWIEVRRQSQEVEIGRVDETYSVGSAVKNLGKAVGEYLGL